MMFSCLCARREGTKQCGRSDQHAFHQASDESIGTSRFASRGGNMCEWDGAILD